MSIAITTILGTARAENQSAKVAAWVGAKLDSDERLSSRSVQAGGLAATVGPEVEDQAAAKWRETAKTSDGFIIISPEYNHGYPGELKLLLDSAYSEYKQKPVALIGVSAGRLGGARVVEQLRLVVQGLTMVPVARALNIASVSEVFDEAGELRRPEYDESLERVIEELLWLGRRLKTNK